MIAFLGLAAIVGICVLVIKWRSIQLVEPLLGRRRHRHEWVWPQKSEKEPQVIRVKYCADPDCDAEKEMLDADDPRIEEAGKYAGIVAVNGRWYRDGMVAKATFAIPPGMVVHRVLTDVGMWTDIEHFDEPASWLTESA